MYGCESWTIKKAEHRRIDAFELWCGEDSWRVPWTARKSNQSILKEINPEYSLEGLILQYFGHLMHRTDLLEKTLVLLLKAGGEGDDRGWDGCMESPVQLAWVWASSRRWWSSGRPGMLLSMGLQRLDMTEQMNKNKRAATMPIYGEAPTRKIMPDKYKIFT